jgi:hypothetical protein
MMFVTPTPTIMASASTNDGITATSRFVAPNARQVSSRPRSDERLRAALPSAPITAPSPSAAVR